MVAVSATVAAGSANGRHGVRLGRRQVGRGSVAVAVAWRPDRPPSRCEREQPPGGGECIVVDPVVGPHAAPFPSNKARLGELLQVVGHRRLKALADPARLRLLSLLLAAAEGEACTCELTEPLGLSQPTVTHHLKKLAEAGLVAGERRGVWTYYRVDNDALAAAGRLLAFTP